MTTTPTNPTILPTWVTTWEAFVKAHERIIIIVGILSLGAYFGHSIYNGVRQYLDNKHLEAQSQINQQIAQQAEATKTLEAQIAQMQQNYDSTVKTLEAAIAAQKQVVVIQQKKDDAMPPVELSERWQNLVQVPEGSIAPEANGNIGVSVDAAHKTVDLLETIPQLNLEIGDVRTELQTCNNLSAQKDKDIAQVHTDLDLEKKGRADDAKVAKDNERKSFWKGTKVGAALATAAIVAVKILLVVK